MRAGGPGSRASQPLALPRPLPKKNERGRSADQTDKRPSQEGGGRVAVHTNFVPHVTQPWLSDGDHAKAGSLSLQWRSRLAPLAKGDSPCGSSHPGEGTRCFRNHLGVWGTFSHHIQGGHPISIPTSQRGKLSLKGAERSQTTTALGPSMWPVLYARQEGMQSLRVPEDTSMAESQEGSGGTKL